VRTAFIQELIKQARLHPEIFLIVGDLGYSVVEPFASEFPERFLNAGVAEQNMTGVAAGLASEGFHVFTYSIGNFPTLRCLEQIRNDVCYHNLPVTVVAVGAGMAYGNLGYSHHCIQDVACLRGMPNMTILSPADPREARESLVWLCQHKRPSYLRIGKAGEPMLHDRPINFHGPILVSSRGASLAMVAMGSILEEALKAAKLLSDVGVGCDVYSFLRVAPQSELDLSSLRCYARIFTVEEHVAQGGVGEILSTALSGYSRVTSFALNDSKKNAVGASDFLRLTHGLNAANLVEKVLSEISG
jgi:transketolase